MSGQVTITQLPLASAIVGTESVPIVQNGVTVQTTTGAISGAGALNYPFLTVGGTSGLSLGRYLSVGSGLTTVDNGAGNSFVINMTGAAASLNLSSTGIIVKTATNTVANRSIAVSSGLTISNADGTAGNPTVGLGANLQSLSTLSGTGLVTTSGGSFSQTTLLGTTNQIAITNGNGSGGSPTIGFANNPSFTGNATISGSLSLGGNVLVNVPSGNTAKLSLIQTSYRQYSVGMKASDYNFYITDVDGIADRLVINTNGTFGINVTPATWISSIPALQIGHTGSISSQSLFESMAISSNIYFNGTNKFIVSGWATQYSQSSGYHNWFSTLASGAANATANLQNTMSLDPNGNLIVSGQIGSYVFNPSQAVFTDSNGFLVSNPITGTGSVVLSNSPTLTGNVSANVNLRSDTLNNLLALAGGTSEIASPTDSPTLVKYNGTAGQAKVLGYASAGTLNYYVTDSIINGLNAGTTIIDCNNVSYLNIYFDPTCLVVLNQLNIKLPAGSGTPAIPELNVTISYTPVGIAQYFYFYLSYQAIDVTNSANFYLPITPDYPLPAIIGTAGAPASVGSYVINYTKSSNYGASLNSALTFSDGTTTYNSGTYIKAVSSSGTQVTLSNPAKVASTGLTITATGQYPQDGTNNLAKINASGSAALNSAVSIKFISSLQGGWTRLPLPSEATRDGQAGGGYLGFVGQKVTTNPSTVTLTSGTVSNSSSITLPGGIWILYGSAIFTTQVGMIGTLAAGAMTTSSSNPNVYTNASNTQINGSLGTSILLTIPTQIIYANNETPNGIKYYGNALFTAGTGNTATVTSQVNIIAVRIA